MAAPGHLKGKSQEQPFHDKAPAPGKTSSDAPTSAGRMPGDLMLMATLIGIGRALFGRRRHGVAGAFDRLQGAVLDGDRGRDASTPAELPGKGWKDIAWRVYDGVQNDRVLLIAAGVTFYALLALFPATAAAVSL
jgi:hypothetical protein